MSEETENGIISAHSDAPDPEITTELEALPPPELPQLNSEDMNRALRQLGCTSSQIKNANALRVLGADMQKKGIFQYALGELIHSNNLRREMIGKCRRRVNRRDSSAEEFCMYVEALNNVLNGKDKNTQQILDLTKRSDWQSSNPERHPSAPPKRQPIILMNVTGNVECKDGKP